ncbi:hypothetical protein P9228_05785 [Mesorhizobium sp. WSM4898]|uniref:hypothetical protein n=1 Tax=Mesorhizobium sp. WSM4898 TaxID=3038544 RepID=UPI00241551C3|nr:hypothetical protein [Mesorhizobium sp. WSM4898]MDG4905957.1 hypothetical protein [Mesorhizobium sp. WSM4898]
MSIASSAATTREPYQPGRSDWAECYGMLCRWCEKHTQCEIVEAMIAMKDGGAWPDGGWVSDPGAGVTCLSYEPANRPSMPRQQRRAIARTREADLPPVCGGCAARKDSQASVSLHTRRDYQSAVRSGAPFVCHEDPEHKRLCGGWSRAIARKGGKVTA